MAENKKPVKVIKAGDMSAETKALPDETRSTPKGIGKSENDMGPTNPGVEMLKGVKASEEAAKNKDEMEKATLKGASMGGMGPMQAKKKGGKITAANYDKEYGKIYRKAVKKMAKGGTASSRADGCAVRGKTKA